MTSDLTRSNLARVALAAWVNVDPDQLPADKMWIEHPNDVNRQAWDRVIEAVTAEYKAALQPFASLGAALPEHYPHDSRYHGPGHPRFWYEIDPAHIWAARAALTAP